MTVQKKAYAKINLFLKILGRREDGYHDISTIMQRISLADEVKITVAPGEKRITVRCSDKSLENEQNTAYRAAELFLERAKIPARVELEIEKKIPARAGLGGGSSDAASVLSGLHECYPALPERELFDIAARVGADVPFFLKNVSCALCEGIGEHVTPIKGDFEGKYCLIAKPACGISTKQAYEAWDRYVKNRGKKKIMSAGSFKSTGNYFAKFAFSQNTDIKRMHKFIMGSGALSAGLCGSGSALFGVFGDLASAQKCEEEAKQKPAAEFCGVFEFA